MSMVQKEKSEIKEFYLRGAIQNSDKLSTLLRAYITTKRPSFKTVEYNLAVINKEMGPEATIKAAKCISLFDILGESRNTMISVSNALVMVAQGDPNKFNMSMNLIRHEYIFKGSTLAANFASDLGSNAMRGFEISKLVRNGA
jgi:hypothetical protein